MPRISQYYGIAIYMYLILRIKRAKVCGPFSLDLTFNDGTRKCVNLKPLLRGPIFQPLKKAEFFKSVKLDTVCGTVCWPNGADFAPEALLALKPMRPPYEKGKKARKTKDK
jgi:hypothetical protein